LYALKIRLHNFLCCKHDVISCIDKDWKFENIALLQACLGIYWFAFWFNWHWWYFIILLKYIFSLKLECHTLFFKYYANITFYNSPKFKGNIVLCLCSFSIGWANDYYLSYKLIYYLNIHLNVCYMSSMTNCLPWRVVFLDLEVINDKIINVVGICCPRPILNNVDLLPLHITVAGSNPNLIRDFSCEEAIKLSASLVLLRRLDMF
jgi:hypothetical protein